MAFCNRCGSGVPAGTHYCANCGQPVLGTQQPQTPATYAPPAQPYAGQAYAPQPAYAPQGPPPPTQGLAIGGLILNLIIWPGLGTLVAGDKAGWAQGFLMLGGLILTITIIGLIIGIPMMIGAWIWALVSSVRMLSQAS